MNSNILPAILLLAAGLAGCQPQPEPLRIVSSPWPGYEPIYLARDLGYLNEQQFVLHELPSANITMESFRNGSADIATITLDETLTLLSQGKGVRILAVMDVSNGADAVMAKPHVKTLADLKGKRIAISNIPLGVFMLGRTLDAAGLKETDVSVTLLPEDKHLEAYEKNQIDVAITFEPFKTQLAQSGAHTLFDSSKIPNEIFDLLVTNESVYKTRHQDLCHLVQQWFRTLNYVQTNPEEAQRRISKRLGMAPELYQDMLDGLVVPAEQENMRLLAGDHPTMMQPALNLARIMLDQGMIRIAVDPALAMAPEFLPGCLNSAP